MTDNLIVEQKDEDEGYRTVSYSQYTKFSTCPIQSGKLNMLTE